MLEEFKIFEGAESWFHRRSDQIAAKKTSLELQNDLESGKLNLNRLCWHGLTNGEPLILKEIITDCFANPDRQRFPDFFKTFAQSSYNFSSDSRYNSSEYFTDLVNPELESKFNQEAIRLHNQEYLGERFNSTNQVDTELYLRTVKKCRWYGPYKETSSDIFCFFAITHTGDNDYTVGLCVNVDNLP